MGLAFRFTLSAADLVGTMAAQSIGLNAASMFDPATEAHDSAISRTISLFALSFRARDRRPPRGDRRGAGEFG